MFPHEPLILQYVIDLSLNIINSSGGIVLRITVRTDKYQVIREMCELLPGLPKCINLVLAQKGRRSRYDINHMFCCLTHIFFLSIALTQHVSASIKI